MRTDPGSLVANKGFQRLQSLSQAGTGGMEIDYAKIDRAGREALDGIWVLQTNSSAPRPYADTCSARFLFLFCPRNCRAAWRTRRQNRNGTTSSATSTPLRKRRSRPARRASSRAARPEERPEPSCEAWGLRLPPVIRREDGRDFIERQKFADRPAALIACRRKKRFVVPRPLFALLTSCNKTPFIFKLFKKSLTCIIVVLYIQ